MSTPSVSTPSVSTPCCAPLVGPTLTPAQAQETATVLKALADPVRVRIVNLLAAGDRPACVCEMDPALGVSQPTLSHHLKKLTTAGLLHREQRGKWAYYSVAEDALARVAEAIDPRRRGAAPIERRSR